MDQTGPLPAPSRQELSGGPNFVAPSCSSGQGNGLDRVLYYDF